ncbi:MAG TPA: hypothetical protein PKL83_02420 [bacterium]|nr:hypothetical protein [bacterium]
MAKNITFKTLTLRDEESTAELDQEQIVEDDGDVAADSPEQAEDMPDTADGSQPAAGNEPPESVVEDEVPADEEYLLGEDEDEPLIEIPIAAPKVPVAAAAAARKRKFWTIGAALAILALIVGLVVVAGQQSAQNEAKIKAYQDEVLGVWLARVDNARAIKTGVQQLSSVQGFQGLNIVVTGEKDALAGAIASLSALDVPKEYAASQTSLVAFLIDYKDYLNSLSGILGRSDPANVSQAELDTLIASGKSLSSAAGTYRSNTDFIKQDVDNVVFDALPVNMRSLVLAAQGIIEDEKQKEEEDKKEEEDAEKQKEQDKADAEGTADLFMQAIQIEDTAAIAQLLVDAVREQYVLALDAMDKVVDFTILSTTEKEGYYLIVVKITVEKADPDWEPPLSGPVGEAPLIRESTIEELNVIKEAEEWRVNFVEFLE